MVSLSHYFEVFRLRNDARMMMNDEEFFPNPEKFLPERHMHEGNAKVSDECNPAKIVFGFGKRLGYF